MNKHNYKIRYYIGEWNKPIPEDNINAIEIQPGIRVSNTDIGYADEIFIASIMRDDNGEIGSVLLLDSNATDPRKCSKEILLTVAKQIKHHLEHHS